MPRNNHNNIRREFKHIWKNFQRGQTDDKEYVCNWLRERGLWGDLNWIMLILLKTNIPSRVIARFGKAAKKRGGYVKLKDLYYTFWHKKNKTEGGEDGLFSGNVASDYHLIEFVQVKSYVEEKSEVRAIQYLQFETLLGQPIGPPRSIHTSPHTFSSVKISEEKYL